MSGDGSTPWERGEDPFGGLDRDPGSIPEERAQRARSALSLYEGDSVEDDVRSFLVDAIFLVGPDAFMRLLAEAGQLHAEFRRAS